MMSGLREDERKMLGIEGYKIQDFKYLNFCDTRQDEISDAENFSNWRSSLETLGIPFMDVLRVLSAILLLGNVQFIPR